MENIEPVTAMFTLLAVFTSPQVAEILAPYIIITMGAFTGASWTLGAIGEKLAISKVIFFYIKSIFTAILITVFISHYVSYFIDTPDIKWLFAPVAFILGMVGNKWMNYLEYVIKKISSRDPFSKK